MEEFTNNGMRCVVLDRKDDTALICIVDHSYQPFLVAHGCPSGRTDWRHGTYFRKLSAACQYWQEEVLDAPFSA